MRRSIGKVVSLLLVGFALTSCAAVLVGGVAAGAASSAAVATDPRSSGGVFDDQDLRGNVSNAIDAMISGNNVEVTSYNQNILLTGQVISDENKLKAENVARQVAGVKKVYNYIEVGVDETATQVSKDAYLTSMIKSNLLFAKGVSSNDVKVVTSNSVVYLLGMVDSYQANKMSQAASAVDGVKKVVNLFETVNNN